MMSSGFNSGGLNLNYIVSNFLHTIHVKEMVAVLKYQGNVIDDEGRAVVQYSEPIPAEVQIQDPRPSELKKAYRINANSMQRKFFCNMELDVIDRIKGTGGDRIIYDGYLWHVTSKPNNFNKQGWTGVIAEAVMTYVPNPT